MARIFVMPALKWVKQVRHKLHLTYFSYEVIIPTIYCSLEQQDD